MPDWRRVKDRLFTVVTVALALLAVAPLFHILATVVVRGGSVIVRGGVSFFTDPPAYPGSGELGGVGPALLGTLWLGLVTSLIGVPLALLTAIYIVEYRESRLARIARVFTSSLLEVPTVLIGMLVFLVVVVPMGRYSLAAGSIALAIVMLPYTVSYVERALEGVPRTYREAGYSIGMTRAQVVFQVVMGIASRGVAAGILIGVAKVLSETAPLLFTIGSARGSYPTGPQSLLEPGDALPLLIFQFAQTPYSNWQDLAWGAALLLTLIILAIFALLRLLFREVKL